MKNICLYCFYSEEDLHLSEMFEKYNHGKCLKCIHMNSAYYNEYVNEDNTCRLFMDEKDYFFVVDRAEKINKIRKK